MTDQQKFNVLNTGLWLSDTVRSLIDETDMSKVRVVPTTDAVRTVFEVEVPLADVGKVVGKCGHHARAIRQLLYARGAKDGWRYELDILQPDAPSELDEMAAA